jgi:hypothetical protein
MAKLNPYKNTSIDIFEWTGNRGGKLEDYLKANIKKSDVLTVIKLWVELKQHIAFEDGRKQGNFESSKALKELIEVEDPGFVDFREIEGL